MANTDLKSAQPNSASVSFGIVGAIFAAMLAVAAIIWATGAEEVGSGDAEPAARTQADRVPVDNDPDTTTGRALDEAGEAMPDDSAVGPIPKDNPDEAVGPAE